MQNPIERTQAIQSRKRCDGNGILVNQQQAEHIWCMLFLANSTNNLKENCKLLTILIGYFRKCK